MAASGAWRKLLNGLPIFDVLRQSRENLPSAKDCKGLLDIRDGELYLWNSYNSNLLTANLKCLGQKAQADRATHQTLLCTRVPVFEVEWLAFSQTGAFVALVGQRGLSVLQLPHRSGKYAEFEAGKKKITCKTITIGERLFISNRKVRVLHVAWHPGSTTDTHLVVLTSDNHIRIYNLTNPQTAEQTYPLSDASENYSLSASRTTFSVALGETAVAFDFGPKVALEVKSRLGVNRREAENGIGWPIYILWGNGDVYSLLTSVDDSWPVKSSVRAPLSMHPPAEDNYGTDACSLACLQTTPPVLVVATCSGKLYHCVALPKPEDDCDSVSEIWNMPTSTSGLYEIPTETSLYVFESIELELSLTTVAVETDEVIADDFSCPIRLHKDPGCPDRYHCSHSAGVHTIVLPWIHKFQQFVQEEHAELPDASSQEEETVVEHLICTKPLPTSPLSPVLGLTVTDNRLLGPTLLCLTSTLECIALPLVMRRRSLPIPLLSTSPMKKQDSPLKRLHKEPFDDHVQAMLKKNSSNPLLKGAPSSDLSAQELFQLLSRSTQVFREERIQKLDLVRQEIERRVRLLTDQKEQQVEDLKLCQEMRNILTENAGALAERYEDAADRQQQLVSRLESVLRKLQSRCGELSKAERSMQRELSDMEVRLKQQKNTLQQLTTKQKYQAQQLEHHRKTSGATTRGSPAPLGKTQMQQLKTVLKDEGDQISDLVKQINTLKGQLQV